MAKNRYLYLIMIAVLSGLLLAFSWPPNHFTYLIFIAFVPLLYIVDELNAANVKLSNLKLFSLTIITFFLWNILTTWWLSRASFVGGSIAVVGNTIIMSVPFLLYHQIKRYVSSKLAYISLITFWMSVEYIHLNWDLAWPWLNLGNIFGIRPTWIQWYEYTGTFGGTLWILLINISVYSLSKYLLQFNRGVISSIKLYNRLSFFLLTLLIPLLVSFLIKVDTGTVSNKNVVVVQPNIDPYNEKFREGGFANQLNKMLMLSDSLADSNTLFVIWPETAISVSINEQNINHEMSILYIREFLKKKLPQAKIISGMDSYHFFEANEPLSPTARKYDNKFYDSYNSALLMDTSENVDIYHKSKLVPGVEKMPYPRFFRFLEKLTINMGGTSGSLGQQKEASVFKTTAPYIFAPVICYESVFGDYVGDYILKDANIIAIITNDGWWGTSQGYKQHLLYAVLRAIETRKFIVRSANTGTSCFVDPSGKIIQPTEFWVPTAIKHNLLINNKKTFYSKNGDYLARISIYASILFILIWIPKIFSERKTRK